MVKLTINNGVRLDFDCYICGQRRLSEPTGVLLGPADASDTARPEDKNRVAVFYLCSMCYQLVQQHTDELREKSRLAEMSSMQRSRD